MLDVAIRREDGSTAIDWQQVGIRSAPPLPVHPALRDVLPSGLRRGSTVAVSGSHLARCSPCSARRRPTVHGARSSACPGSAPKRRPSTAWICGGWRSSPRRVRGGRPRWAHCSTRSTSSRPARPGWFPPMPAAWPLAPAATKRCWCPTANGRALTSACGPRTVGGPGWAMAIGRLQARRLEVHAEGKGQAARPRSATLWLPAPGGGVEVATPVAPVIELAGQRSLALGRRGRAAARAPFRSRSSRRHARTRRALPPDGRPWPADQRARSAAGDSCAAPARPAGSPRGRARRPGPSAIDTATARFSSTTGDGATCASTPYSDAIRTQSVSSARGARAWQAAISACSTYHPRPGADALARGRARRTRG